MGSSKSRHMNQMKQCEHDLLYRLSNAQGEILEVCLAFLLQPSATFKGVFCRCSDYSPGFFSSLAYSLQKQLKYQPSNLINSPAD